MITVSDKERDLLADFLGEGRVFTLPLAEHVPRSPYPLAERRGMYFVGNFRHLPNREAVEHLANDVLPQLDPELLARHPLTVVGNWLDRVQLDLDPDTPGLRLVGWVPTVAPYVERSRLAAVPLLHGAGVKRKVIQAMMAGTPVVTTPVGAEGLDLVQGETALIARDATDLAAGLTRLLTDDDLWHRMAAAGADHADRRHGVDLVEQRFAEILEQVMTPRPTTGPTPAGRPTVEEVRQRIRRIGRPGDAVLVVCGADHSLLDAGAHPCWPFPQSRDDADRPGPDPVDGTSAVHHLEAQRTRGARYFVLPRAAFSWRRRYPELARAPRHRVPTAAPGRASRHLGPRAGPPGPPTPRPRPERPRARATAPTPRTAPARHRSSSPSSRRAAPSRSSSAGGRTPSRYRTPSDDADFVVHVRDDVIAPARFLDRLVATQVTLDVERLQPAHTEGPSGGPPVTERHFGVVAR